MDGLARAVPLLASAALLGGCAGFTPLYAQSGVSPALQSVEVSVPQGRPGYLMRQQLNDELARDFTVPARYRLDLEIAEQRFLRGVRVNNVATEVEVTFRVGYQLVDTASGAVLTRGVAPITTFYATPDAPYAGIAAQQDAQERAASTAATQIRLELSRYFARNAVGPAP